MDAYIKEFLEDVKKGLKDYPETLKEFFITLAVMLIAWIVLGILNYLGIESKFLIPLHFLTASLNGFEGDGWFGVVGGIIAKITLLMLITQTLIPIIKDAIKPNDKDVVIKKYKKVWFILKSVFAQGANLGGYVTIGVGISLLIYAFLSVNGNLRNSFVIVLAIFSTIRILAMQTSVLIRVVRILVRKPVVNMLPVYSLLIGMSIGFTLSVSLAAIFSSALLGYSLGGVVAIIGYFTVKKTKNSAFLQKVK